MRTTRERFGCVVGLAATLALAGACGSPVDLGSRDAGGGRDARSGPINRSDECGNGIDDDHDGRIDDGCPCGPGERQACFSGPSSSRGVGACTDGVQTCGLGGVEWGDWGDAPCVGGATPAAEQCDGRDHDCDGARDESCPCTAGATQACGVEFLTAPCRGGTQTCRSDGTWSGCDGAIGPMPDVCDGTDNDCDGVSDEGCGCAPEPELCRDGRDNDCDGEIDELACEPDWPPTDAGVPVPTDASIPPPPTCASLVPATGPDWHFGASPTPDSGGSGANLFGARIAVDSHGDVYVLGQICSGSATVFGVPVTSGPPLSYARVDCNPWLAALHPDGTARFVWSGVMRDLDPPGGSGPSVNVEGLTPDEAGGVWITGSFAGRYSPTPGVDWEESTSAFAMDGFLIHLNATGAVVGSLRIGEYGTTEYIGDVVLTRDGVPVIRGMTNSPILLFGSTVVRPRPGSHYIIALDPSLSGAATWIVLAEGDAGGTPTPIEDSRMVLDPTGAIVIPGGSNGNVRLGATPITSTDRDRGHAWLWTISPVDGSTIDLHSWQAVRGYYAHASVARVTPTGIGFSGNLRGEIDFGAGPIACGTGLPSDPSSPLLATLDTTYAATMSRAFPPTPFDGLHGFGTTAADWTSCLDTVLVGNIYTARAPDSQLDFGDGLVTIPTGMLQIAEWDRTGALRSRVGRPAHVGLRVNDIALSPLEHVVYVVGDYYTSGTSSSLSVDRFAL